jgi:Calx-beta domain
VPEPLNTALVDTIYSITVTRSAGALTQVSTINYAITDGTATLGSDYSMNTPVTASGTLTFASGVASMVIKVNIKRDLVDDGTSENFTVTLSAPTNAKLGTPSTATVTITDND